MSSRIFAIFALLFGFGALFFYLTNREAPEGPVTALTDEPSEETPVLEGGEGTDEERAATDGDPEPVVAEVEGPSFDVVRVDPSGTAVFAGRGEPGSTIRVLVDGETVASETISPQGEWAIFLDEALEPGTREVTLEMALEDGTILAGADDIIVDVPERESEQTPLVVSQDPDGGTDVISTPADVTEPEPEPIPLAIAAIDLTPEGVGIVSGRADPGSEFALYVDNELVGQGIADDDGKWEIRPDGGFKIGTSVVRVDEIGDDRSVLNRVEREFVRDAPEEPLPLGEAVAGGKVVVEPGNSLWRIARNVYGSGFRYTTIYEQNRDQIRDPDLIYPGQVFELPVIATNEAG